MYIWDTQDNNILILLFSGKCATYDNFEGSVNGIVPEKKRKD